MPSFKHNFIDRLARLERSFRNDRGNLSLMFAFAVLPICLSAGMAIDYTRAANVKSRLQHAVDAAALAAGSMTGSPQDEVMEAAEKIFHANFEASPDAGGASVTTTVEATKITVSAQTTVGTTMMKLANLEELAVQATAEATPPQVANGEIVLVLDYSWSMTDTPAGGGGVKWETMRDSAKQLVATLGQSGANNHVKFALTPFSEWVRLSMPKQYVLGQSGSGTWTGCTKDRKYPYNMQDTAPTASNSTKFRQCGWRYSGGSYACVQASSSQCNQYASNQISVMELTDDHQSIQDRLDDMYPIGNTHIPLGLSIGWHVISPGAPFTTAQPYGTEGLVKAIVLLTDGAQTVEAWGPGDGHSVAQGEDNLEELCTAVKASGATLITVAFDLDHAPTVNRLRNCATAEEYAYDIGSGSQLANAFLQITGQLASKLYLSK